MNRREVLAGLAAGAVAVPGCLSDSGGAGDGSPSATVTGTPTETGPLGTGGGTPTGTQPGTEPGPDAGASADFVEETFAVPELAAPNSPDSFGVYGDRDEQFVVALLTGDPATAPPAADIELVADEERFPARTDVSRQRWGLFDYGTPYLPDRDAFDGWVVFRLPNPLDADDARIGWPGGEHALDDDAVATLARPPTSFAVGSLEAPEAVSDGESFTLSFTVENTGDADGTFVGAVNRNYPAYAPVASIRLPVAAGERATWERTVEASTMGYDDGGELRLWLYWREGGADRAVTVDVAAESATTTATPTATETRPITPDPSE